jgi:hypothetical protein
LSSFGAAGGSAFSFAATTEWVPHISILRCGMWPSYFDE